MTEDQWTEIIRQLATLTESVGGLHREGERRDEAFEVERRQSYLARRELYEKVNTVAEDVATVKGDVKVAGMVAAQARDTAADLKSIVEKAAPTIADVEQAKKLGAVLLWLLGGGAIAIMSVTLAWGAAIKAWLSHWLGIK